jgi:ElaB/YqjD/DUF883 family membrane-anchored ribosome-binding protein
MMTTDATDAPSSGGVVDRTQEVVGKVQEVAQEHAGNVRSIASDRVRSQVVARSTQAGEQLDSITRALRAGADHLRGEGNDKGAEAAHQAADQTQRLASYLSDSSADKLLDDLEGFARSQPWLVMGIGTAAGFMASRFLKASSERRYQSSRPQLTSGQPSYPGYPTPPMAQTPAQGVRDVGEHSLG